MSPQSTQKSKFSWGDAPNPPRIASMSNLLPIMEHLYPQTVIFSSKICEIFSNHEPRCPQNTPTGFNFSKFPPDPLEWLSAYSTRTRTPFPFATTIPSLEAPQMTKNSPQNLPIHPKWTNPNPAVTMKCPISASPPWYILMAVPLSLHEVRMANSYGFYSYKCVYIEKVICYLYESNDKNARIPIIIHVCIYIAHIKAYFHKICVWSVRLHGGKIMSQRRNFFHLDESETVAVRCEYSNLNPK